MKVQLLLLELLLIGCQVSVKGQDKLFHEKQSVRLELGSGLGDLFWHKTADPHTVSTTDLRFQSWPGFQTNIAYGYKLEFVEYEVKLGFNYSSYYYSYTQSGGRLDFATTVASGTIANSRFYIQPIGFNFGKDRSWGNLFGGGYVRWVIDESQSTNGTSKTDGLRWDGANMVPIHSTAELKPIQSYHTVYFGVQAGANIRLKNNHFLRIRIEANPYRTRSDIPFYVEYFFNVGYSYVFRTALKKEIPKT